MHVVYKRKLNQRIACNDVYSSLDVEKTDKGRCPLRRRTFRRGSSTCQNRLCQDPRAPSTIRLLGRSPADVCEDGNLPTTVLVGIIQVFCSRAEQNISGIQCSQLSYVHEYLGDPSVRLRRFENSASKARTDPLRFHWGVCDSSTGQCCVFFQRSKHRPVSAACWTSGLCAWHPLWDPCLTFSFQPLPWTPYESQVSFKEHWYREYSAFNSEYLACFDLYFK